MLRWHGMAWHGMARHGGQQHAPVPAGSSRSEPHSPVTATAPQGLPEGGMRRIILTASGGAFRDLPVEKLAHGA